MQHLGKQHAAPLDRAHAHAPRTSTHSYRV